MREWYYLQGGERLGPVTAGEINELVQEGRLVGASLVWKEGFAEWTSLGTLPEFTSKPNSSPPVSPSPNRSRWYHSAILQVLALLFLWPLGAYGLVKNSWSVLAKVIAFILTLPIALFWVMLPLAPFLPDPPPSAPVPSSGVRSVSMPSQVEEVGPAAQTTPEEDTTPRGIGLGEEFRLGKFSYIIDDVRSERYIGNEFTNEIAPEGAIFVLVGFRIRNEDTQTRTVLTDDFELRDSRARSFRVSSDAATALAFSGGKDDLLLTELQPGILSRGVTPFLIPTDALQPGLTLVIPEKGFWGSDVAEITLIR